MECKENIELFDESGCLSQAGMLGYIDDLLSFEDRHRAEKHLLDCEFCSDALEGLEAIKNRTVLKSVNEKIQNYRKPEPKVISLWHRSKKQLAIAAAIIFLAAITAVLKFSLDEESEKVFSQNIDPKINVEPVAPEASPSGNTYSVLKDPESKFEKLAEKQGYKNKEELKRIEADDKKAVLDSDPSIGTSLSEDESSSSLAKETEQAPLEKQAAQVAREEAPVAAEAAPEMYPKAMGAGKSDIVSGLRSPSKKSAPAPAPSAAVSAGRAEVSADQPDPDRDLNAGMKYYEGGIFTEAIKSFEASLAKFPGKPQSLLYCGISYLNTNQINMAETKIASLLAGSDFSYYEAGKYYKALILLKKDKRKEAKQLLTEIVNLNSAYKEKASAVLKDLD